MCLPAWWVGAACCHSRAQPSIRQGGGGGWGRRDKGRGLLPHRQGLWPPALACMGQAAGCPLHGRCEAGVRLSWCNSIGPQPPSCCAHAPCCVVVRCVTSRAHVPLHNMPWCVGGWASLVIRTAEKTWAEASNPVASTGPCARDTKNHARQRPLGPGCPARPGSNGTASGQGSHPPGRERRDHTGVERGPSATPTRTVQPHKTLPHKTCHGRQRGSAGVWQRTPAQCAGVQTQQYMPGGVGTARDAPGPHPSNPTPPACASLYPPPSHTHN